MHPRAGRQALPEDLIDLDALLGAYESRRPDMGDPAQRVTFGTSGHRGSSGDFAKAYVIAHEFGHHLQTLTGASAQVREAQQRARGQAEANRYSVALELQADCYAGVWARNAALVSNGEVALEPGDLEAGMKTAQAIGDDALQSGAGRRVSPESFTHGSSAQRVEWLQRGYRSGDPAACDTFSGA